MALPFTGRAEPSIPAAFDHQPPRIRALLEQAWALETGDFGLQRNPEHAAALYCEAARHGNSEGHYRSGLIHLTGGQSVNDTRIALFFLRYALEHGHPLAETTLREIPNLSSLPLLKPDCLDLAYVYVPRAIDLPTYVAHIPPNRQQIAHLVSSLAPGYGVEQSLALAIAAVESNFNPLAVSPKQAMGVMQLMPATAARFKVTDPFDVEQNIRGGLAYLGWLLRYFKGNRDLAVAAYNAGEGAVERHGKVPPYTETINYLKRVQELQTKGPSFAPLQQSKRLN